MFDLEQAIVDWRARMAAGGVKDTAVLDELEAHLREGIQEGTVAGKSTSEAFEFAVARIGTAKSLRTEFNKISGATFLPVMIGSSLWVGMMIWVAAVMVGNVSEGKWNVLLFTHLLALTAAYLATFLMGLFAMCFVFVQYCGKLSPAAEESFGRATLRFSGIAAGLSLIGLILGIVWSGQNRGAYWSGTPREVGALLAAIWFLATWLVQRFSRKDIYARMLACIGSNIVGALGWFGAVLLEPVINFC